MLVYTEPSPFPPSFEGDPLAYMIGLFGDLVSAGLALAILLGMAFETRNKRAVSRMIGNHLMSPLRTRWSVLYVHRAFLVGVLGFIVMRTLPDAAWMLLWGEVDNETIRILLKLDLVFDGVALVPFFFALICWAWSRQAIPQKLYSETLVQLPRPTLSLIAQNAKIILVVLLISIGVTIGKAAA